MKKNLIKTILTISIISFITFSIGCQKNLKDDSAGAKPDNSSDFTPKELKNFVQVNLVGDNNTNKVANLDANLVDGRGITFTPSSQAWISSCGRGINKIYNLDGLSVTNAVSIPHSEASVSGLPTGQAYNFTSDFKLPNGNPAEFIIAAGDGTISGWNDGNNAVKKIDNSPAASYMGIALANIGSDFFIYAANFAQNRIDVFDKNWNPVNDKPFIDPDLPAGYSPINIQVIGDGKLYVIYAKKNSSGQKEVGQGNGYIDVFSPDGSLQKRFASGGKLNAPWGITKAPAGFWGEFSQTQLTNIILVANSGDGHINVFDESGNFLGQLAAKGKTIEIDGLWGITFPPLNGLNRYYLYFAAGPNNGINGLMGYIKNQYLN